MAMEAQKRLMADKCQKSFYHFVKYAMGISKSPKGRWFTREFHLPLCLLLQRKATEWLERRRKGEQGRSRVMVVVPRGFGKTWVVTKAFPMWCQLQDPDLAVVITSESTEKAQDFMFSIRTIYAGHDPFAMFNWFYGNWKDPNRLWRDNKFTHAFRKQMSMTEPSFNTTSVEKGATGFHPDMLIVDDLISLERLRDQGNWLDLAMKHVDALIPALRTDSFQLVVGTPYANNDVIYTLLEREGIAEAHGMPLPRLMPKPRKKGRWALFFAQARDQEGHSTLPTAWSDEELDDYERDKPMDFAAQMMCTPGVGEHMPLDQEQIDRMWVKLDDVPQNLTHIVTCDTAFKTPQRIARGDDTVIEHWGYAHKPVGDVYYLEGYGSNKWGIDDFGQQLVLLCQRIRSRGGHIRAIVDEKPPGGKEGAWESYLQNLFSDAGAIRPPIVMLNRQHTQKVARMTEAAGYWIDGRVHLVRNAPGAHKLVRQMLQIGIGPHDDWADAAADIFNKAVYRPFVAFDAGESPMPSGPYDHYLRTGILTNDGAIEAYDRQVREEEEEWASLAPW